MRKTTIIFSLCCFTHLTFGQIIDQSKGTNLILNPSFEFTEGCLRENQSKDLKYVYYWNSPNITTPDIYCTCNYHKECVTPKDGTCYVGGLTGTEFPEGQLKCELVKGQTYYFEMYVNPAIRCTGSIVTNKVGAAFLSEQMSAHRNRNRNFPPQLVPQVQSPPEQIISDTTKWTKVSGTFVAEGGERFVILGWFPNQKRQRFYLIKKKGKDFWKKIGPWGWITGPTDCPIGAYYVYDDVKLFALDSAGNVDTSFCTKFELPEPDSVDYTQMDRGHYEVVPSIRFKTGSSKLKKGSDEGFKLLWAYFHNPLGQILELKIHTDTLESPIAEEQLCERRSKVILQMLKSWGIPESSVRFDFKRSTEPLQEEYRKSMGYKNERIEFRLVDE